MFYALNARLAANMARVLGRPDEAASYDSLAGRISSALNARFLDASGRYETAQEDA